MTQNDIIPTLQLTVVADVLVDPITLKEGADVSVFASLDELLAYLRSDRDRHLHMTLARDDGMIAATCGSARAHLLEFRPLFEATLKASQ